MILCVDLTLTFFIWMLQDHVRLWNSIFIWRPWSFNSYCAFVNWRFKHLLVITRVAIVDTKMLINRVQRVSGKKILHATSSRSTRGSRNCDKISSKKKLSAVHEQPQAANARNLRHPVKLSKQSHHDGIEQKQNLFRFQWATQFNRFWRPIDRACPQFLKT
jgi:hypothetical protein